MIDFRKMQFVYKNYKGEISERHAEAQRISYGATEWHSNPQWLMTAFDLDKKEIRHFAMKDMTDVTPLRVMETNE